MIRIVAAVAVFLVLAMHSASTQELSKPLHLITPAKWADMSDNEQQLYVLGVLKGWSFDLYANKHPDLKSLVECVTQEGVEKITVATQNAMLLGEAEWPAPWWVARGMGAVCGAYRR